MKIKQEWKPGVCEAMRCKEAATTVVPLAPFLEGLAPTARAVLETSRPTRFVAVCARCQAKAVLTFGPLEDRAGRDGARATLAAPHFVPAGVHPQDAALVIEAMASLPDVIPTASVESEIAANRAYALEQIEAVSLLEIETQDDYDLFAELLA
jgi:hypothetical protein